MVRSVVHCLLVLNTLLFLSAALYSQDIAYRQYTVKEGLPGSIVYHTIQDKDGFIWFATNQGVSRFDGRTFKNFSREDGLPDNEIIKLYIDKHNTIWFISISGIPAVYYKGGIRRLDCQGVLAIAEDKLADSIILLGRYSKINEYYYGYYSCSNEPGKWQFSSHFRKVFHVEESFNMPILRASGPDANFYYELVGRSKTALHIKTRNGYSTSLFDNDKQNVYMLPFTSRSFVSVLPHESAVVFDNLVTIYYADSLGIEPVLALKEIGLNIDKATDLNYLYCENDSVLWLCTRNKGLIRIANFRKPEKTFRYFFANSFCTSILKDAEGGYWVTTLNEGIYYLPDLNFYTLPDLNNIGAIEARCIKTLDAQTLAAGFTDGTIVKINHTSIQTETLSKWAAGNKYNRVLDIKPWHNNLLVATDGGLFNVSARQDYKNIPRTGGIKEFLIESDTSFIVACASGLFRIKPGTIAQTDIYPDRATCIAGNGRQYFWGSLKGVYKYSGDTITALGKDYPALSGIINNIALAPDAAVWVATQQGVVVFKDGVTSIIKQDNGLLSNNCRDVLPDGNTTWVSTDKGISRINYQWQGNKLLYTVLNITENDGLISDDVNQVAVGGQYIWAATARGISFFSRSYQGYSFIPPFIAIDRIVAGNTVMASTDTVYLDRYRNNLAVEIAGVAYHNARKMEYQYRVNGLDSNWYPVINNSISFSALPYGQYVLEIGAFNKENQLIVASRKIVIIGNPPFWRSAWFIIFTYVISILSAGVFFYLFYRKRQQKKEQVYLMNKKISDLEVMALRAQMNPHFIFNCLNSIQHYILTADVTNANLYLHRFSMLIRKILQLSPASLISLREEIEMLELYLELEQMRLDERMTYRIIVADNLNRDDIHIPSMIIQPYLENAIKHGISPLRNRKGTITVDFRLAGNNLECLINDDGIGINAALQHKQSGAYQHVSMGTNITENRLQAINSIRKDKIMLHITDRQELNKLTTGTFVQLLFPIETE